jgi:hypothetical protein
MEFEKNLAGTLRDFHNLDLTGVLRMESVKKGEIGWS